MISKKIGPIRFSVKICSNSPWPSVGRAVDQDAVGAQPLHVLAVAADARVDLVEIGVRRVLEAHAAGAHRLDGGEDVVRRQRHVLDALAVVVAQELLDLRLVVLALVQREDTRLRG